VSVYMFVYVCAYTDIDECAYECILACLCVYVCVCACVHACPCVRTCVHVGLCVRV